MEKTDLQRIIERGVDFFVTGNEYIRDGLNLKFIPHGQDKSAYGGGLIIDLNFTLDDTEDVYRGGIIFADSNQDLAQSYSIAKNVFEYVERGTVKFVLIGLSPYVLSQNDTEPLVAWDMKANVSVLEDYIKLCLDNEAKPVGVVLPFAPDIIKACNKELLNSFREMINHLENSYDFFCVDMLEISFGQDYFSDVTHLKPNGIIAANALLALKLYNYNLIPAKDFRNMSYEYFDQLALIAPKDEYNILMKNVFKVSAQMISYKDKIKIGFVLRTAAEWCGDELYNFFANDEKFEPTVFLCVRSGMNKEIMMKEFYKGVEQFKSHKLNFVAVDDFDAIVPSQDIMFFLTPYFKVLPSAFHPENIIVKTLISYITYGFSISQYSVAKFAMSRVAWKFFFPSIVALKMYDSRCEVGMPRAVYSGHSKTDVFFDKNAKFHFNWKMTRPDAKKIIWAPHWSINIIGGMATFHSNYLFMYEFAKAHPEISWVVKPHPGLFSQAISQKVFPSVAALEEYFRRWNDLPNAQVYTGTYYQNIFATSDGMIQDCASFIAEYQFVDKPMIYLMSGQTKFNELGNKILKASYTVDGKDLDVIATTMQRVFIEGDDYKAAERKKVFDEYLNYPKYNGTLASEFIYKNIVDDLKGIKT